MTQKQIEENCTRAVLETMTTIFPGSTGYGTLKVFMNCIRQVEDIHMDVLAGVVGTGKTGGVLAFIPNDVFGIDEPEDADLFVKTRFNIAIKAHGYSYYAFYIGSNADDFIAGDSKDEIMGAPSAWFRTRLSEEDRTAFATKVDAFFAAAEQMFASDRAKLDFAEQAVQKIIYEKDADAKRPKRLYDDVGAFTTSHITPHSCTAMPT